MAMELIITGRHIEVDEDMKAYADSKFQKLAVAYPKLTSMRVVLSTERKWQVAEAHVHGKQITLNASEKTQDMAVSIDGVMDKLERQLRKHLERLHEHRAKHLSEAEIEVMRGEADEAEPPEMDEEPEALPLEATPKA
jgi:putative sigma-54 modulation protein